MTQKYFVIHWVTDLKGSYSDDTVALLISDKARNKTSNGTLNDTLSPHAAINLSHHANIFSSFIYLNA